MNITKEQADKVIALADQIACLGNGERPGNSHGNELGKQIATIMRGLAEDAEPVALPGDLVIKALLAMDAEARKRGEMYPQTLDEQREDTKSVRNVIASLEFYTSEKQCDNGWPSVKDWPALPATSPQAAQTEAQEREAFEAWIAKDCGDLKTFGEGSDKHYLNMAVNHEWIGWIKRAGRKP